MVKKVVKKKGKSAKHTVKSAEDVSPTLMIAGERDIASDFATKVYDKFGQMIKSIVLLVHRLKKISVPSSDIDIIIIIDDVSIKWDQD